MGLNAAWASFTGLTLALAAAGVSAQPARSGLPPLPPELASKHSLDERALQALRPPGQAPVKARAAPVAGDAASVKAPPPPKTAATTAQESTLSAPALTPLSPAPAPGQSSRMSLGLKSCKFEYKGKTTRLSLAHDKSEVTLEFKAEKGCLTAASSDQLWVEAAIRSFKQDVLITLEANPSERPRTANLFVVAGDTPLEFTVTQEGKPATKHERSPVPESAPPLADPVPPATSSPPLKGEEPKPGAETGTKKVQVEQQELDLPKAEEAKSQSSLTHPAALGGVVPESKKAEEKASNVSQQPTEPVSDSAVSEVMPAPILDRNKEATASPSEQAKAKMPEVEKTGVSPAESEGATSSATKQESTEPSTGEAEVKAKPFEPANVPALLNEEGQAAAVPAPSATNLVTAPTSSSEPAAVTDTAPSLIPFAPGDGYEEVDLSEESAGGLAT